MNLHTIKFITVSAFLLAGILCAKQTTLAENKTTPEPKTESRIEYNRDIRPILSDNCFTCHGPDSATREADLRLDLPEEATKETDGNFPIKPADPQASLVMSRILSTDPDEKMPPADSELELTQKETELIRKWIEQGAEYQSHWAYKKITRPDVPAIQNESSARNPIDHFILRKLEEKKITPSPEADRSTLIRRLALDLTGLPPEPAEVEAFLNDKSENAYEKLVDHFLASPHYGERWGRHWLDQARYADTNGYTIDSPRSIWPYRDWVINAFNSDMPFDQFTIEQIAGDLLPEPTQSQLVATGFNRNTLVNQEGGTDDEQFRNEIAVDRVNTTGAVWLGLTVGCAQCHNHKFDSITQKDFYQLFAFFNQSQDVNSVGPILKLPTEKQTSRIAELTKEIKTAQSSYIEYNKKLNQEEKDRLASLPPDQPVRADKPGEKQKRKEADPEFKKRKATLDKLVAEKKKIESAISQTMIMRDRKDPRETFVLIRGDFLSHGEKVTPGTPAVLHEFTPSEKQNRLDLANWLVSKENPLTARVFVNRIWMHYFGRGIVETENDFGVQGSLPTHPELLHWLASEFTNNGWSMKSMHRLIVTSATYRQSSHARPDLNEIDPKNILLARQSRIRVDAEVVRDLSLAVSGLLSRKIGGPSVYPPQPEGVYSFTQRKASWPTSTKEARFRRGMYTFFMRSAPYPMLTTFDTPRFNATCTRRVSSNTPLQSLTMSNDEAIFEMAQGLGKRILTEPLENDHARIEQLYLLCFSRKPKPEEVKQVTLFLDSQRKDFEQNEQNARQVAGEKIPENLTPSELASWTMVARVLFNLDEFITRE